MRQRGFTLLEVLVAMVIVSFGLIGLVGLTMTGAKNDQGAYQRSQASWIAYDIVDRMRANRVLAQDGDYNIALGVTASGSGITNTDLTQWKQELANALPAGDGSVLVQGGYATVVVRWNDSRGLGTSISGNTYSGNSLQSFAIQALL